MILIGYIVIVERPARSALAVLALFIVGLAIYNLWRIGYYPTPLPHTFYAKVSFSGNQILRGGKYLFDYFLIGNAECVNHSLMSIEWHYTSPFNSQNQIVSNMLI